MFNPVIKPKFIVLPIVLAMAILPRFSAQADQIFAYSDGLSSSVNLNMSQTNAKLSGGMAFTADDSVSSIVVSNIIANPVKAIISARLDASDRTPSNARIIYYLSNNNGQRWTQVNSGYTYSFDSVGNQLVWKAVIARESIKAESPYIDSINLAYTVSDTLSVNQNNIYVANYGSNTSNGVLNSYNDLNSFVCSSLALVGVPCGSSVPTTYVPVAVSTNTTSVSAIPSAKANTSNNSSLTATAYNAGSKNTNGSGTDIILVRVPKHEEIYEIIGGKKHLIPTKDIFYDYGFTDSMIQPITQAQLDRYPRVKVIQVAGDKKKSYYLTEGYMVRLVPKKMIADSYGDREEDTIVISKKEFNYYPPDQFVFLERPLRRDVFQVVNGGKRYVTSMALERMRVKPDQIAPVNETELTYYKTGSPIIF